jgi:hypothetical protein
MTEPSRTPSEYPTIARLADLSATTVGYQLPDLVREAVLCWRELTAEREARERAESEVTRLILANEHWHLRVTQMSYFLEVAESRAEKAAEETPWDN